MSFRKRNAPLSSTPTRCPASTRDGPVEQLPPIPTVATPGVRPSPIDGRPTISTGTASLDGLLAGHAGLALGNCLLLEESGTTDYAGSLLRFYAAEGVVQGQQVHVVGMGEYWGRELPGLVSADGKEQDKTSVKENAEKMKIAWRYERLGEHGSGMKSRGPVKNSEDSTTAATTVFCHNFDLTKRLTLPSPRSVVFIPINRSLAGNPFDGMIERLDKELSSSSPGSVHRLIVPSLLSPAFYPKTASHPTKVLQFLHSLRALLRSYPTRLTAIISIPLTLFPRSAGLTRWIELLCDGVLELVPFPHTVDAGPQHSSSGSSSAQEEKPQGMVRIHRLPIFHERGGGGIGSAGVGEDLAFTLSRRRFVVKPFSLPPIEGDQEAQQGDAQGGKMKVDIDF